MAVSQALFIAPCGHSFHYKCIRPLLMRLHPGWSCPLCRAFADLDDEVDTIEYVPPKNNASDAVGALDVSDAHGARDARGAEPSGDASGTDSSARSPNGSDAGHRDRDHDSISSASLGSPPASATKLPPTLADPTSATASAETGARESVTSA